MFVETARAEDMEEETGMLEMEMETEDEDEGWAVVLTWEVTEPEPDEACAVLLAAGALDAAAVSAGAVMTILAALHPVTSSSKHVRGTRQFGQTGEREVLGEETLHGGTVGG